MNLDSPAFNEKPVNTETVQPESLVQPAFSEAAVIESMAARETTYPNNTLGITHTEHWDKKSGDTIAGSLVSSFMEQIWNRLRYSNGSNFLEKGGPFLGYQIHTWNLNRAVEGGIDKHAGLTNTLFTKVNSQYLVDTKYGSGKDILGGIYSHEFAHNYHMACQMFWDGKTSFHTTNDVAKAFVDIFRRLRGVDARPPGTNEVERLTEDIKYFFGTNGIAGVNNPDDDANKGTGVRWAKDVIGLKDYIRGLWPIYNWLKDKKMKNFTYNEAQGTFKWERLIGHGGYRWEMFSDGAFFRWDGFKWQPFNKRTTVKLEGKHEKWKPTGVRIVKGETIKISASGTITFFVGGNFPFPPAGESTKKAGNGAPAPGLIANSLVVSTGGSPVYVGNGATITADNTTELFIAANDDWFPDNDGFWTVNIEL